MTELNAGSKSAGSCFPPASPAAGSGTAGPESLPHEAVVLWIYFTAACTLGGWALSILHALSPAGYAVWMAATTAGLYLLFKDRLRLSPDAVALQWRKIRRRFWRGFPLAFLALSLLILAGGLLYAPNNFDGLSYRIPRMLHWWMHGGWLWIDTPDARLNTRVCGFEWLCMPMLVLFKSDRGFFLPNFVSFLFLPGLLFSFLTRLGLRRRAARYWMWIFPAGCGFALQAGGMANDGYTAVYSIAMIELALRARATRDSFLVLASLMAAALLTGAKNSNLPLMLCWAWAIWPCLPLLRRRTTATAAALAAALAVSALPTIAFNLARLHDWTGYAGEKRVFLVKSPVAGALVNAANLLVQNCAPPFFPIASQWNRFVHEGLPAPWRRVLRDNFETECLELRELPSEEWAGVGLGVMLCLAIVVWRSARRGSPPAAGRPPARGAWVTVLLLTPWIGLLVYMAKAGMAPVSRLILPYFPLLLPGILIPLQTPGSTRGGAFRAAGVFTLLSAMAVVVVNPARPLFPALTLLSPGAGQAGGSAFKTRARRVFKTYRERHDTFGSLRRMIPPGEGVIGFISLPSTLESSLWLPYGERRVRRLTVETGPGEKMGLRYVIADASVFENSGPASLAEWLRRNRARVVQSAQIVLAAAAPDTTQLLIELEVNTGAKPVGSPAAK